MRVEMHTGKPDTSQGIDSANSHSLTSHRFLLDRRDFLIALCIAVFALIVYTRVLAPDLLYGDSAEFQTLAYTWGTTHTTGYPVYLLLARVIGFIPVNTLAWRINFASAIAAAITLGGVYLLTRQVTNRGGALLTSAVLLVSYTFWSQSIIAEVYIPATAFVVVVLLVLLYWSGQPTKRRWWLFLAGFLMSFGLGVHLFLMLIAPSLLLYVLWGIVFGPSDERGHWRHLLVLVSGVVIGLAAFFLLFATIDTRPTPTSMFATAIYPSRETWGLQATDLDSVPERFWISVSGYQWRDRMLPDDVNYQQTLISFFEDELAREYALPTILLALIGILAVLVQRRRHFVLLGSALVVAVAAGLVYFPGDKYLFYLPAYLLMAVFAGAGVGVLITAITRILPSAIPRAIPALIITVVLVFVCVEPYMNSRWRSIEIGRSGFVREDYVFPVRSLTEPRQRAECAVSLVAESEALLLLEWRALYSIYYIAHVEQGRTGLVIYEALPYPARELTTTMLEDIEERLQAGEAVYVDNSHPALNRRYSLNRVAGECNSYPLFRVSLRS